MARGCPFCTQSGCGCLQSHISHSYVHEGNQKELKIWIDLLFFYYFYLFIFILYDFYLFLFDLFLDGFSMQKLSLFTPPFKIAILMILLEVFLSLSLSLSLCLSVSLSLCLCLHLSISLHLSLLLSLNPSTHLSICLSICLSMVYMFSSISVYTFIHIMCLSIWIDVIWIGFFLSL